MIEEGMDSRFKLIPLGIYILVVWEPGYIADKGLLPLEPMEERRRRMKMDATEKTLLALSKKVGRSVRAEAKTVKKTLIASFRKEMSHAKTDAGTIVGRKSAGKA